MTASVDVGRSELWYALKSVSEGGKRRLTNDIVDVLPLCEPIHDDRNEVSLQACWFGLIDVDIES